MRVEIPREKLEKWADYLLEYSLDGISKDDVVMIKGEPITWPLIYVLEEKVIKAGGIPDVNLVPPDNDRGKVWSATMARYGTLEQIKRVPQWHIERYRAMTKYIEVLGAEDPSLYSNTPEETTRAIMQEDEPIKNIRLAKPWVLTLYPTKGFADLEGMTLERFTEVVVNASMVDPRLLDELEEDIYQVMRRSKTMRIVTRHPKEKRELELTMSIANRNIVKCTGKRNFPDGEVFTSPDANTVEGEIFVDLPVSYSGVTIRGIYLRFEKGRIVDYTAEEGFDTLQKIIETDEGSHRLGEVALGMNNGIEEVLKHPLFVEKVGGTLHIAIGASYPECFIDQEDSEFAKQQLEEFYKKGIANKSAQHVDIVTDFRPGGTGQAVYLDDVKLEIKDNIWVVPK
ncbi:aminopeptidase [Caldithrix abyssi]|uniref:Leucyl aminopeptidase (Aminopeptidase T) n=1 Tax=Caldithrix abyssi DSM 13497 TaxID=880073 RepID=H1XP77_CALAY|nr:aminopeptidase [Caldithrix abyssi]APF18162.1 Leucyl aminopeptidase (aminopeptidase T) [Caldithrix abyssi DSM 13497]EHO42192.1 peptidase M29 aminopeptidase II [Caldithrix abyssi DSM 13497]